MFSQKTYTAQEFDALVGGMLRASNNLSDIPNAALARANLGITAPDLSAYAALAEATFTGPVAVKRASGVTGSLNPVLSLLRDDGQSLLSFYQSGIEPTIAAQPGLGFNISASLIRLPTTQAAAFVGLSGGVPKLYNESNGVVLLGSDTVPSGVTGDVVAVAKPLITTDGVKATGGYIGLSGYFRDAVGSAGVVLGTYDNGQPSIGGVNAGYSSFVPLNVIDGLKVGGPLNATNGVRSTGGTLNGPIGVNRVETGTTSNVPVVLLEQGGTAWAYDNVNGTLRWYQPSGGGVRMSLTTEGFTTTVPLNATAGVRVNNPASTAFALNVGGTDSLYVQGGSFFGGSATMAGGATVAGVLNADSIYNTTGALSLYAAGDVVLNAASGQSITAARHLRAIEGATVTGDLKADAAFMSANEVYIGPQGSGRGKIGLGTFAAIEWAATGYYGYDTPDVRLRRTAANTLTLDNGADGVAVLRFVGASGVFARLNSSNVISSSSDAIYYGDGAYFKSHNILGQLIVAAPGGSLPAPESTPTSAAIFGGDVAVNGNLSIPNTKGLLSEGAAFYLNYGSDTYLASNRNFYVQSAGSNVASFTSTGISVTGDITTNGITATGNSIAALQYSRRTSTAGAAGLVLDTNGLQDWYLGMKNGGTALTMFANGVPTDLFSLEKTGDLAIAGGFTYSLKSSAPSLGIGQAQSWRDETTNAFKLSWVESDGTLRVATVNHD